MADPGNSSAEFSPAELDRLEDALERWTADVDDEVAAVPEDSSLAPPLRARLESYRSLMVMAREEMPLEDVPDGLLAGVLAEAARSGPAVATRRDQAPAGPSLWERLRRSMLVPGVALAGSAALLLWMVQPDTGPTTLAESDSQLDDAAAPRLSKDARPAPAAAEAPEPMREAEAPGDAPEESAAGAAAPPAAVAPGGSQLAPAEDVATPKDSKVESEAKFDRAKPKPMMKKAEMPVESYPGLDDDAADPGADKEALRDTLDQADAARRKGRCDEAMRLYVDAMRMSGPASERAQARAGYGLCLQQRGEEAKALRYFDAASDMSASVDGWIRRERGDSPAKKSAKPSPSPSSADSPFGK